MNTRDLPPNLYMTGVYFVYRTPDGTRNGMGRDRNKAIAAAIELNHIYLSSKNSLVERITSKNEKLSDFLIRYREILVTEKKLAPSTLEATGHRLATIERQLGKYFLTQIDVLRCAEFLDQFPPRQSNVYRGLLADIYKWAIAKGLCTTNPATATIRKAYKVQRQRWSLGGYQAAREAAPAYIQRAMDIALHTLLRREDVVKLHFNDYKNGRLKVATQKTGARLDIAVGPALDAIIRSCRDDALSPCMIHYPIGCRRLPSGKCLKPQALTRAIQRARDKSEFYAGTEHPPTFHEIRSLGAKLYEGQGMDPQALLGHTDAAMTRVYLDRYEVQWIEAEARLKL